MTLCEFRDSRLPERFWSKVIVTDAGCWEWAASVQAGGYSQYRHAGTMRLGHRVAYTALVGPIPEGLDLDHLCRVRRCVNPNHLEPVTRRENVLRGEAPARLGRYYSERTACPQGHPYDEINTAYRSNGGRQCKECNRIRSRERQRRLRAERHTPEQGP